MKLVIKLLEREPFDIEIPQDTLVGTVKQMMNEHLRIPTEEQRLIFRGVILHDDKPLTSYMGLRDGCKLNLIMVTKKRHPLYKKLYNIVRLQHSEKETQKILNIFMRRLYDSFRQLSLDDLERIAHQELADNSISQPEKMIVD